MNDHRTVWLEKECSILVINSENLVRPACWACNSIYHCFRKAHFFSIDMEWIHLMQGSSFNGEKNQRLLSRFYGLYCQGERQRGRLTASLSAQSSGHHAMWCWILDAHHYACQCTWTEWAEETNRSAEGGGTSTRPECGKALKDGPYELSEGWVSGKVNSKVRGCGRTEAWWGSDEHSWICMPLMYYDDAWMFLMPWLQYVIGASKVKPQVSPLLFLNVFSLYIRRV